MSGWTVRFTALAALLALLVLSSAWEMHALRRESEIRLQQEAGAMAKRTSLYFAGISWEMDAPAARSSIFIEMEDTRLAGMMIYDREGLLEGMRRNSLWEPVPWDDLMPENCVEASAPITIEGVPAGEVVIYLSRRALDEELSARARRELTRVAALALIPCIAMALLLWRLAAGRAVLAQTRHTPSIPKSALPAETPNSRTNADIHVVSQDNGQKRLGAQPFLSFRKNRAEEQKSVPPPLQLPPDWDNEDVRLGYLQACRAFIRDRHGSAALLYRLAAHEDWGELCEAASALRKAALALNARPLAAAALAMQKAALDNTTSAARHVENFIPALAQVFQAIEQLLRDNAESSHGEQV